MALEIAGRVCLALVGFGGLCMCFGLDARKEYLYGTFAGAAGLALLIASIIPHVPIGRVIAYGICGVGLCGYGMAFVYARRVYYHTSGSDKSQFVFDCWLTAGSFLAATGVLGLGIVLGYLLK